MTDLGDGHYRFDVVIFTSTGAVKVRGCRYVIGKHRMLFMPSLPVGGHKFYEVVTLPRDARRCLRRLAEQAIAQYAQDEMVRRDRKRRNEDHQVETDTESERSEPVDVQPEP